VFQTAWLRLGQLDGRNFVNWEKAKANGAFSAAQNNAANGPRKATGATLMLKLVPFACRTDARNGTGVTSAGCVTAEVIAH